jgi:hypothetical protein
MPDLENPTPPTDQPCPACGRAPGLSLLECVGFVVILIGIVILLGDLVSGVDHLATGFFK